MGAILIIILATSTSSNYQSTVVAVSSVKFQYKAACEQAAERLRQVKYVYHAFCVKDEP